MNKKLVVLGGGTGQSVLLQGLKQFPYDISAVVSVSDDGKSSGTLRKEFNIPAVGDIRRVLISLSETEDVVEELVNYRFRNSNTFEGHTIGNLILTALIDLGGNLSNGIEKISKVLKLKGDVLPLTNEYVTLMGEMEDGQIVEGEHMITQSSKKINKVYYKNQPKVNIDVVRKIKQADAIIISMGSLFTSIIPNLLCKEVINAIDKSNAKIIYICNIFTQPGETDNFKVSDHINLLNLYLGKRKIEFVITNKQKINSKILKKYLTTEQKDLVEVDDKNIHVVNIKKPLIKLENGYIRHDNIKLALEIMNILVE